MEKAPKIHELLENYKPDCVLIAEIACSTHDKLITPHDDYQSIYYPVNTQSR